MIQLQVLNKILDSKNASFIIDNNISSEFFSDYEEEFNFIKEHFDAYSNILLALP